MHVHTCVVIQGAGGDGVGGCGGKLLVPLI